MNFNCITGEIYNPRQQANDRVNHNLVDQINESNIPEYNIGVKQPPPLFPGYRAEESSELLDISLRKNVAWSLVE